VTAGTGDATLPGFRWDFFISYTQADRAWAEWIAWELNGLGYRVLLQAWDMLPGSDWRQAMRDGIRQAERTLAILSNAYLKSVYGQVEWQAAQQADPSGAIRKLIPIRVEDCPQPEPLDKIVSFDLFHLTEDRARAMLIEQVTAIRAGRDKPRVPPAFPGVANLWRMFNRRIPEEAHLVMGHQAHKGIRSFVFTSTNGWAMITDDNGYRTRSVPKKCFDELADAVWAGSRVDCLAFPPRGNSWVIVTDRGPLAHNIPEDCVKQIDKATSDGRRVRQVAFPPGDEGWVVVEDAEFTAERIDADCHQAILDLTSEGKRLTQVAFTITGGWVVVAENRIRSHRINGECLDLMNEYIADGWLISNVAFAPLRDAWSVYSYEQYQIL
jgi:hypothetical protein